VTVTSANGVPPQGETIQESSIVRLSLQRPHEDGADRRRDGSLRRLDNGAPDGLVDRGAV
jgi:hypothetical protein